MDRKEYFRKHYKEHREERREKARKKYRDNEEYRAACIERAKKRNDAQKALNNGDGA